MRILVCGGRDYGELGSIARGTDLWDKRYAEYRHVTTTLDKLAMKFSKHFNENDNWLPSDIIIIHGGATGVDSCADQWVATNWSPFEEYKADWATHKRAAGPIRNQKMLDEGNPDLVVAFPGGVGTADMVRRAEKAGIPVQKMAPLDTGC